MNKKIEVPFFKADDVTYYLTHTNSNKPAIQVIGNDFNLSFYTKSKNWYELTSNTQQNNLVSSKLHKALKKLKSLRKDEWRRK